MSIRSAFIRPVVSFTKKGASNASSSRGGGIPLLAMMSTYSKQSTDVAYRLATPLKARSLATQLFIRGGTSAMRSPINHAHRSNTLRATSSSTNSSGGQKDKASSEKTTGTEGEEPMSQEIVLTPGEKVVVGTRLFFWAGAFAFASVCAYYIGKELIPTKMSPNNVFDKATSIIRENAEVKRRFGEAFKTYGRDHGGHREGRRNFIEHTEYVSPDDGTKRTRVRFNLEGQYGNAFVFAEVSKDMPSGEFVYLLVQDKRNGQVITVVDNRSALLAKRMAGGSQEGADVFANLLGGGKK
eukprot:scaffold721_cov202-Alexandrium_tamarense.AAC.29